MSGLLTLYSKQQNVKQKSTER